MLHVIENTSPVIRFSIAYTVLVGVACADYFSDVEVSMHFFYLLPVVLVAWFEGKAGAVIIALVAGGAVLLPSLRPGAEEAREGTQYWNAAVAGAIFVSFALAVAFLRDALRRLAELSRTDPLTEISNRRSFLDTAGTELVRARRSGRPFSLMYLDLDNFKRVNDTLGHQAGDSLLRTVSAELRAATRSTDVVARLGGDEFVILLPETGADGAADVSAKVRSRLQACMNLGGWPVTFSIGVVSCMRPPDSVAAVVDTADRLMYSVKKSGKNGLAAQTM